MLFNTKQIKKLDERQQLLLLKSYQLAFWVVLGLLWLVIFLRAYITTVIPHSEIYASIFWLGLMTQVTYLILTGAHPLVDPRHSKKVLPWVILLFCFALIVLILSLLPVSWLASSGEGLHLSFIILFLTLVVISGSCIVTILKMSGEVKE